MDLIIHFAETHFKLELRYAGNQIIAGFPSPAEDYLEATMDLNKTLIKHPASTFYGRVKGVSMIDAGVSEGDLLIIDKSLRYKNDALAVCFINGEFTLKRIRKEGHQVYLVPANSEFKPIEVKEDDDFSIWGIVTYIIKRAY